MPLMITIFPDWRHTTTGLVWPVSILPFHDSVSVRRLVLPVPVVRHSAVLIIAPVTEHSGTLGHFALVDLALGRGEDHSWYKYRWLGISLPRSFPPRNVSWPAPLWWLPQSSQAPFSFFKHLSQSQHASPLKLSLGLRLAEKLFTQDLHFYWRPGKI